MSKNKKGKQRAHFQEPPVSSPSEDHGYNGLDQIYEQDEHDDEGWPQGDDGWEGQGDGQEWNDDRGWDGNEGAGWGGQGHGGETHAASGGWKNQGVQQTAGQGGHQAGGFAASVAHALGQAQGQAAKAGHNEERAAGGIWGAPDAGWPNNGAGGGYRAAGNNWSNPAPTSAAQGRGRTMTAWPDNPAPANVALPSTQGTKGGWQGWANEAGMKVPQQQGRAPVQAQPQRQAAAPPPTQGTWNAWGAEAMVNGYRAPPVSNPVVQVAGGTRTDVPPQQRSQVLNTLLKGLPRHAQAPPPPPKESKEKKKQGKKNKKQQQQQQQQQGGWGAEDGNLWTAQGQDEWGATGQDEWGGQGHDDHGAEAQGGWGADAGAGDGWGQQANDSGWGEQTQGGRGEQTQGGWGDQTQDEWGNQTQNGWDGDDLWRQNQEQAQAQEHHQLKRRPAQKRDGWGGDLSEDDWEQVRNEEFDAPETARAPDPKSPQHHFASMLSSVLGPNKVDLSYQMPSKAMAYAVQGSPSLLANGTPKQGHDLLQNTKFLESRGAALNAAQRAFYGENRIAKDRIHWAFSPHKDDRVVSILEWIQAVSHSLASFGLQKFLQTRERGALFVNADYRPQTTPQEPAFDWLTYDQLQYTKDRILQESVAYYDPALQVIVFVFLLSASGNSMAIWRRKIMVPNNVRLQYTQEIQLAKAGLKKDYPIYADEPRQEILLPPPPAPEPVPEKKRRKLTKRKWWKW